MLGLVEDKPALRAGAASDILDKTYARRSARRQVGSEEWSFQSHQGMGGGNPATPEYSVTFRREAIRGITSGCRWTTRIDHPDVKNGRWRDSSRRGKHSASSPPRLHLWTLPSSTLSDDGDELPLRACHGLQGLERGDVRPDRSTTLLCPSLSLSPDSTATG